MIVHCIYIYHYVHVHVYTAFLRIEAGVSISFVGFLTRPLNEVGLYSGEASNRLEHDVCR